MPILPFDYLFFVNVVSVASVFEPVAPCGPSKSLDCAHDTITQYTFIASVTIFIHSNSFPYDPHVTELKVTRI